MKRVMIAAVVGMLGLTAAAAPAEAQVNRRQWNQQERIHQGARSGELNGREYRGLQRQQGRIARYEARSRYDGRGLSYRERARLDNMQDRASRRIARQKHDRQGRRW